MMYHQQFITRLHSSVNLRSSTFCHLRHKYSIVTSNMLVPNATSNTEAETYNDNVLPVTLHRKISELADQTA